MTNNISVDVVLEAGVDNVWFTSDIHFSHANIIKYCDRPFKNVEEMNESIIASFNSVLDEDSLLFNLGDVTMNDKYLWYVERIKGHHWLIPGNHDAIWPAHKLSQKEGTLQRYRNHFDHILRTHQKLKIDGIHLLMSHLPYTGDAHGEDKHTQYRPTNEGVPLICGHVHEAWRENGNQLNVGVDVNNFKPVPASEVLEWAKGLEA